MDFIACINSVDCAMPANIETAAALEIKQSCSVGDAYQILTNYPNLKHIKVAGETYSRQTVGQMPIDANLGGPVMDTAASIRITPPAPPGRFGTWEIDWGTTTVAGTTAPGIWIDEAISPDDVYGLPI